MNQTKLILRIPCSYHYFLHPVRYRKWGLRSYEVRLRKSKNVTKCVLPRRSWLEQRGEQPQRSDGSLSTSHTFAVLPRTKRHLSVVSSSICFGAGQDRMEWGLCKPKFRRRGRPAQVRAPRSLLSCRHIRQTYSIIDLVETREESSALAWCHR